LLSLAPIGAALSAGLVYGRMTSGYQTYDSRMPLIQQAFYLISHHPILGVGANAYVDVLYNVPRGLASAWMCTVHNGYLFHWAELGTVGLLTFVWFLLSLGREAWRLMDAQDRAVRAMGLGAFSFVLVEAIFMNGDVWSVPTSSGLSFCMLLALTAFLGNRRETLAVPAGECRGPRASVGAAIQPRHVTAVARLENV
jgi:O-antigen ligase